VYRIDVDGAGGLTSFDVRCDMTTEGGGWTTFQYRKDGNVEFYLPWASFAVGFGTATTDYWLGNDRLATMTSSGTSTLRVELTRASVPTPYYAEYSTFNVSGAADAYRLTVGGYTGNAGDSLGYHTGMQFTTYDSDHDAISTGNCAVIYHGAWWHNTCHMANLNGIYYVGGNHANFADGMDWDTLSGYYEGMVVTEMKVR
jgi:hypothetical protein